MIRYAYYSFACAALCALALVMLSGCSSFDAPKPVLERSTMRITVVESQNLPPNVLGNATWHGDWCVITLREYPTCLQHEVRHCLEGNWHYGRDTTEDCYE